MLVLLTGLTYGPDKPDMRFHAVRVVHDVLSARLDAMAKADSGTPRSLPSVTRLMADLSTFTVDMEEIVAMGRSPDIYVVGNTGGKRIDAEFIVPTDAGPKTPPIIIQYLSVVQSCYEYPYARSVAVELEDLADCTPRLDPQHIEEQTTAALHAFLDANPLPCV